MTNHEICRLGLLSAINEMTKDTTHRALGRFLKAEVTGDCSIGHHFWVKVTDSLRPVGRATGGPGHFRCLDYEVEACCRWDARMKALDQHAHTFDKKEG